MGIPEEVVIEAQEARLSRTMSSINALQTTVRDGYQAVSGLGQWTRTCRRRREFAASALLQCLSERDRQLMDLRFTRQMSQRAMAMNWACRKCRSPAW